MANSIDDRQRLAAINVAWSFVHNWRGELDASIERCLQTRNIAREIGDVALELGASFCLGQAYMWRGDFQQSVAYSRINLAWIDGPLRHLRIGTTGTGSVMWLGMLGASRGRLGNFPQQLMPHKRHVSSPTKSSDLMTLPWRIGGRASSGRTRVMCPPRCNTWSMV